MAQDEENVPTAARRAAEWHPSKEGLATRPWFASASAGVAWFDGDKGIDNQTGFSAEFLVGRELTSDWYVVGSYLLAIPKTEVTDPRSGDTVDETHALHIPTIGVGYRLEVSPEIHLFIEPRIGAVFGSDADLGPVAGGSTGVEFNIQPGMAIDVRFTGLFANTKLDTRAGEVDLSGIWSVGVGMRFEF
jgi:hypothetical protein